MKTVTTTQATASFSSSINVPLRNEIMSPLQDPQTAKAILDNTGYLKQYTETVSSRVSAIAQRRQIPLKGRGTSRGGIFSSITDGYGREYWVQGEGVAPSVRFGIGDLLPAGIKIESFAATIKPATGHSALPSIKPSVTIERILAGADPGVAFEVVSTATEWTTTVVDYQTSHIIEKTPDTPITIASLYNYQLVVHGEDGDNSKTGLQVLSISFVLTF